MTNKGQNCPLFSQPKGKLQSQPKSQATQQKNPQVPKNKWILRFAQYDKERQVGMTRNLSFWAFARKRKIHKNVKIHFDSVDTSLRSVWQEIAKYDKGRQVGMTRNLSFWVSETNEKSIRMLRYTLNLWILRCAQYDKNSSVWQKIIQYSKNKGRFRPLFSQPKGKLQSKPKSRQPASPAKPSQPRTKVLNLWILRCAQYDKAYQYDKK